MDLKKYKKYLILETLISNVMNVVVLDGACIYAGVTPQYGQCRRYANGRFQPF